MNELIHIKVFPDAKRQSIEQTADRTLRIFVREPAERNQANKKVLELVADFYNLPKNRLRMITGHRSLKKIIQIQ